MYGKKNEAGNGVFCLAEVAVDRRQWACVEVCERRRLVMFENLPKHTACRARKNPCLRKYGGPGRI